MARPSNTAARQSEIVQGLMQVMAREGSYHRASVGAVARAAGLTQGLVHYHFESKRAILVALLEHLAGIARERYQRRLAGGRQTPRRCLNAWIDAHLALGDDADPRAVACWVIIGSEAVGQAEVREVYRQVVGQELAFLRGLVAALLRAEGRRARGAGAIAAALWSMVEGACKLSVAAPGVLPSGFSAPSLRRMAVGLIDGEPERSDT